MVAKTSLVITLRHEWKEKHFAKAQLALIAPIWSSALLALVFLTFSLQYSVGFRSGQYSWVQWYCDPTLTFPCSYEETRLVKNNELRQKVFIKIYSTMNTTFNIYKSLLYLKIYEYI